MSSFAISVGESSPDLRLALTAEAELPEIAGQQITDNGRWYLVLGNKPLREVLQVALGLPDSVAQMDLDQQLSIFREKAGKYFGDSEVSQFSDPDTRNDLINLYLARAQIASGVSGFSPGATALALLQGAVA